MENCYVAVLHFLAFNLGYLTTFRAEEGRV